MRSTNPPRCKHCRERTEKLGKLLHDHCMDAWIAKQLAKQQAARAAKQRAAAKVERAQDRKRRETLKSRTNWEQECKAIAQKIARLRDRFDGCISCHIGPDYGGKWHGSHYRPAGSNAAVELHLWNIHKSCAQCNLFKGGNLGPYRIKLVAKIGLDRVEWLESQTQPVKRSIEYLKRYKAVMGKKLKRLEKRYG